MHSVSRSWEVVGVEVIRRVRMRGRSRGGGMVGREIGFLVCVVRWVGLRYEHQSYGAS